ncbi:MAG TPA: hypothetical protein VJU16_06000 [Planctomycetota bacterium]|nr:hypothetical protein [Planctomycetota bacterium]
MTRFLGRLALAALLAGTLAGCIVTKDQYGNTHIILLDGPEPVGTAVTVDCHHHDGCGHYWYNGSWYAQHGHRHGPRCGHYYHGGRWVLSGAVNVGRGHTCGHQCGHYYMDGQWFSMRHHRHGAGCGHLLQGGVWVGVRY